MANATKLILKFVPRSSTTTKCGSVPGERRRTEDGRRRTEVRSQLRSPCPLCLCGSDRRILAPSNCTTETQRTRRRTGELSEETAKGKGEREMQNDPYLLSPSSQLPASIRIKIKIKRLTSDHPSSVVRPPSFPSPIAQRRAGLPKRTTPRVHNQPSNYPQQTRQLGRAHFGPKAPLLDSGRIECRSSSSGTSTTVEGVGRPAATDRPSTKTRAVVSQVAARMLSVTVIGWLESIAGTTFPTRRSALGQTVFVAMQPGRRCPQVGHSCPDFIHIPREAITPTGMSAVRFRERPDLQSRDTRPRASEPSQREEEERLRGGLASRPLGELAHGKRLQGHRVCNAGPLQVSEAWFLTAANRLLTHWCPSDCATGENVEQILPSDRRC